jgi:hypothetical protein
VQWATNGETQPTTRVAKRLATNSRFSESADLGGSMLGKIWDAESAA